MPGLFPPHVSQRLAQVINAHAQEGLFRLCCADAFLGVGERREGLLRLKLHLYDD